MEIVISICVLLMTLFALFLFWSCMALASKADKSIEKLDSVNGSGKRIETPRYEEINKED